MIAKPVDAPKRVNGAWFLNSLSICFDIGMCPVVLGGINSDGTSLLLDIVQAVILESGFYLTFGTEFLHIFDSFIWMKTETITDVLHRTWAMFQ